MATGIGRNSREHKGAASVRICPSCAHKGYSREKKTQAQSFGIVRAHAQEQLQPHTHQALWSPPGMREGPWRAPSSPPDTPQPMKWSPFSFRYLHRLCARETHPKGARLSQ